MQSVAHRSLFLPTIPIMTIDNFPAKEHIRRLVHHLARLAAATGETRTEHIIVLQGEHTLSRHDTDRELPFRELFASPLVL